MSLRRNREEGQFHEEGPSSPGRALAYGVESEPASFRCIDCGHRYEHAARAALPPCPHYQDGTHPLAGWRPTGASYARGS